MNRMFASALLTACTTTATSNPTPDGHGSESADAPATTHYDRITLAFDEVAGQTTITSQYASHATFSTDAGCEISTSSSAGVASSQPNYIWTYYSCDHGPSASYFIDFAKPVKHISFALVGVNSSSKCATVRLVHGNGNADTSDAIGKGDYSIPVAVDLPASSDVKRLEIVDVDDAYGLGVDDLAFDFPQ